MSTRRTVCPGETTPRHGPACPMAAVDMPSGSHLSRRAVVVSLLPAGWPTVRVWLCYPTEPCWRNSSGKAAGRSRKPAAPSRRGTRPRRTGQPVTPPAITMDERQRRQATTGHAARGRSLLGICLSTYCSVRRVPGGMTDRAVRVGCRVRRTSALNTSRLPALSRCSAIEVHEQRN